MGEFWTREVRAPSYRELRPFGKPETSGFPIYPDLEERLLETEVHPDRHLAYVMAVCSAYAYSCPETVSMVMARLGLEGNRCQAIGMSVDAMFLRSTAFVVQSRSGRVAILCYRGTEPLNLINWLGNLDLEPERTGYRFGDPCNTVHGGFYRNTRATRYEVMNTLKAMGRRLEALYITGHSLGGAMAGLMGVMIRHEAKYLEEFGRRLRAVYTFGQPMLGDPGFAAACQGDEFLRDRVIRYIYGSDIVTRMPPAVSGPFQHFGREHRYRLQHFRRVLTRMPGPLGHDCHPLSGKWLENLRPVTQIQGPPELVLAGLAYVTGRFRLTRSLPVAHSIEDHLPRRYLAALIPEGIQNEFGDLSRISEIAVNRSAKSLLPEPPRFCSLLMDEGTSDGNSLL